MDLKLQQLRKAAGYRSRDDFAKVIGVSPRAYKAWERQETNMSFSQACMIADALHCTLDELAGRDFPTQPYTDKRQATMNDDYAKLTEAGKDAAAGAVRGIRVSESARNVETPHEAYKKGIA